MHTIFKLYAKICIYMPLSASSAAYIYKVHAGRDVHVVCRNMQMCILYADMHHIYRNMHHRCNLHEPDMHQYSHEQLAEICTYML